MHGRLWQVTAYAACTGEFEILLDVVPQLVWPGPNMQLGAICRGFTTVVIGVIPARGVRGLKLITSTSAAGSVVCKCIAEEGCRGQAETWDTASLCNCPYGSHRVQVYLTTLEAVKSAVAERSAAVGTGEAGAAGLANFVAGATASLVTQSVIVPVRTA